jgi:integrase
MTRKRGHYGSGSIDPSGKNSWRIRYRIDSKRYTKVVEGTKTEAQKELRRLLQAGDEGRHVAANKMTLNEWSDKWLSLKEPNVKARTYQRYENFLKVHVAMAPLGGLKLQKITLSDIDAFYKKLQEKLAPRTLAVLHVALKSCFATAIKKKLRSDNPVDDAERPEVDEAEPIRATLDEAQLMQLIRDFRGTSLWLCRCSVPNRYAAQ